MARGKIVYTPMPTVAVSLDGAHYLSLASAAFNFGAGSFGVDALMRVDPAVADAECWIAGKGVAGLASAAGWHFYYKPGSRRLGLRINDGVLTPMVVETADNAIPALGTNFWARLEIDRTNDLARFYVDGFLAASGDISAVTGSLDNAEPVKVGAYDASTNRHKGSLDLLRFDSGRILSAAWHEKEWYRLKYGGFRQPRDFLAFWTWHGESLVDRSSGAYELTWQGGGDSVYITGWPGSAGAVTYNFAKNFRYEHEPSYLDLDDRQRMNDASDFTYPHPNQKMSWLLAFHSIRPEQQAAFDAAWAGKQPLNLYLDADEPKEEGTFKLMKYPLLKSVFTDRVDAELDLEQT